MISVLQCAVLFGRSGGAGDGAGGRAGGRAGVGQARGYEDMNTRRMNYARAPHCTQNWPFNGAPQALQKL